MANKKIRATAELFLNTKDAKKDAQIFINDLKGKLQDIESAADKMTVFKDMVEYIAQVDRALAALKANNKDAFAHMFDGLDSNLKAQLEGIFGIDGAKLGKLDVLREQLGNLTLKSSIKEVRSFAKEINTLFTSIGMDAPFENIDEIFSGRTSSEHLKKLGVALANFANVWEDVKSRVSKGFGGGGFGAGTPTISSEIQEEIDKLEEQISHYKSLIDKFKQTAKMKKSFDNFDGIELDFEVSEQAVDGLIKKYNELNDVLDRSSSDSVEYANALAERAKTAMQLVELNNQLIQETPEKKRLTEFIFEESVEEVALDDFEYEFEDCLKNINKSIEVTKSKITELKESAMSSFDALTDGSTKTGFNDIGDAADETGEKVDMLGKKLLSTSEYIQGIAAQLRGLFDVLSKPMDVEYKVMINGQDINIRKGQFEQVSARTIAETYLSNIDKDAIVSAHSHMGGDSGLNHNDLKNIIYDFVLGTAKLGATIGQDGIATWNLAGVAMEDIATAMAKIEDHANRFGDLPVDKVNEIFKSINPQYTDVAKLWTQSDLDGLAQYIYDIGQKSASALTPVERFQNVLKYFARDIDLEKYKDVLSDFKEEDAGNLFNQIMKAEGIDIKVSDISKGSLSDVTREIKEQQDSMLELRQAAQLTYGEIEKVAKEYYETFTRKDNERIGADFFKKYFTSGEMFDINQMFTDIEFGERDLTGVTKTIASYFYIDPDDMIPTDKLNETKEKLESFMALTEEIRTKDFVQNWDATDNIEIGKYTQRLEEARNALRELGQQGLLTSEELEAVEDAFTSASTHLKIETNTSYSHGGGGGYYYESYESEYQDAKNANQKLKDQLDIMRQLSEIDKQVGLTYDYQVDELDHLIEKRKELLNLAEQDDSLNEEDLAAQRAITAEYEARSQFIREGYDKAFDDFYKEVNNLIFEDPNNMDLETIENYINRLNSLYSTLNEANSNYFVGDFDVVSQDYNEALRTLNEARAKFFASNGPTNVDEQNMQLKEQLELKQQIATTNSKLDDGQNNIQTSVEFAQLEQLEQKLREVKTAVDAKTQAFEEEYVTVDAAVGAEVASLQELINKLDEIISKAGLVGSSLKNIGNNPVQLTVGQSGETQDGIPKTPEEQFKADKTGKLSSLTKYINSLKDIDYVSQETREQLAKMREELEGISTPLGLKQFKEDLEAIKKEIALNKSTFEITSFSRLNNAKSGLLNTFNGLTLDQQNELKPELDNAIKQLEQYKINVQEGKAVELEAIDAVVSALRQKLDAYKQVNKEARNIKTTHKKNSKFGDTTSINAAAKYNSLSRVASSEQFESSKEIKVLLDQYTQSYNAMIEMRNRLRNSDVEITDTDKEAFKEATAECNNYAKALDKLIQNSLKLHNTKANQDDYMLGDDFNYSDIDDRKAALANFAQEMYGVSVAATDFKDNWNKVIFAVDNGDGTFTQMTATFTDARNEIVAMAGDTKKVQSALSSFLDGFKGRVKSLAQYFLATVSIYDVWRIVKQGIQHVREIDSALTELKKVTNETDASYNHFLQDMSKTGAVIGATVKDLTSSAADWARLGSIAKSAPLYSNI